MKSMINVILDVSPSMAYPIDPSRVPAEQDANKSPSKLEIAKDLIGHFFLQRIMASKTVELGLMTIGDNRTKNYLNGTVLGYENLCEHITIAKPNSDTLRNVDKLAIGSHSGDLIDGIAAGVDALARINQGKAFNRILLLVTDAEAPIDGLDMLEQMVETMNTITNFTIYIAIIGKYDATGITGSNTVYKRENVKVLDSLAGQVNNGRCLTITSLADSALLLSAGLGLSSKPQLCKISIELAPNVSIPCVFFCPVSATSLPSLKKRPRATAPSQGDEDESDRGALKRDIVYRDPEDGDREVDVAFKVKGYRYGAQYVPVTLADEAALKSPFVGPPRIQIIRCIPASEVPRHHLLDTAMIALAVDSSTPAKRLLTAWSLALRQQQAVALCRVNKRADSEPFLAVLQPLQEGDDACGVMLHRLPCAEDIRDYNFPSLVHYASASQVQKDITKQRQVALMAQLVDAVTIFPSEDGHQLARILTPANSTLQSVLCEVRQRLIHSNNKTSANLHQQPSLIQQKLPDDAMIAPKLVSPSLLREVRDLFPLTTVIKKGRKRKQYFSDMQSGDGAVKNEPTEAAEEEKKKRNKCSKTNEVQMNSLAEEMHLSSQYAVKKESGVNVEEEEEEVEGELPVFGTASVTPVEDFQALVAALLTRKSLLPVEKAQCLRQCFDTMRQIVDSYIRQGASRLAYEQALACLSVWRQASVQSQDCALFNAYLEMPLKKVHSFGRHALVWQLLCAAQLQPVSLSECSSSLISDAVAAAFFGGKQQQSQTQRSSAQPPVMRAADEEADDF